VSGPKRYDWVKPMEGEGGGEGEGEGKGDREGEGEGGWVYLRDGSRLDGLLEGELGVRF